MVDLDAVMNTLIEISKEKLLGLEKIYNLTIKQKEIIELEDIDGLNELIDKKQAEIDCVQELDKKFENIVGDLKTVYEVSSLDELEFCKSGVLEIKKVVSSIMDKVKKIHALEVENMDAMKLLKGELEKKISHAKTGKKAIFNYGNMGSVQAAVFFDKTK